MRTVAVFGVTLACVVVFDIVRRYLKNTRPRSSYPLPPGPRGLPFIGNVIGVDLDGPWLTYAEWAKQYGDLVYTQILGRDIIIINSEAVANELLENRSRNYSDRPYLATRAMCGRDFSTVLMEYGDRWRLHRRFFHQTFRSEAVHRFSPCNIARYTASVILNSVYDYDAKSQKDELFDIAAKTVKITGQALRPEVSILVGAFPALLSLPSWFPGMSFKREMAIAKAFSKHFAPTMVFDALRSVEEKGTSSDVGWIKDLSEAAATGFIAASETSNSLILSLLLMMLVNAEAQKRAQAQIDTVVGRNRLPMIEDRSLLPYVDAIRRETLRYRPIVPLSIPHAVVDDDVYAGFHIPRGAMVVSNLWSMGHNESKYPNPHEFIPERFLNGDGTLNSDDVENVAFGFGWRICVERYFSDTSVWSVIVKMLTTFTIEKARDENGVEILVDPRFSSSVVIHSLPFRCSIVPRIPGLDAEKLEQLIEASTT